MLGGGGDNVGLYLGWELLRAREDNNQFHAGAVCSRSHGKDSRIGRTLDRDLARARTSRTVSSSSGRVPVGGGTVRALAL